MTPARPRHDRRRPSALAAFPDSAFTPDTKGHISVSGQLGVLDGHLLLFADQIAFGSQIITIDRSGITPEK